MKKSTIIFALIVAAMAISCQKNSISSSAESEQEADVAYVSISVNTTSTRASDGDGEPGSTDENKIYSLALLSFDYNYDYIGATPVYQNDDGDFVSQVATDARRFFVVVNPTTEIWTAISKVSSYSQSAFSSLPAIELTAASVSTENYNTAGTEFRGFTMVNCGEKNSSGILLESLVSISSTISTEEDDPTVLEVTVDRMVSKFSYSVSSSFDTNTTNGNGEVLGVALTATNKASYLYSMIYTNTLYKNNVYRTDHNMTVGQGFTEAENIIPELKANFNWLQNKHDSSSLAFISPNGTADVSSDPNYVLENTCEPYYSNSNNLTQAVVKATYNPIMTGTSEPLASGTSWFKMYTTDGSLYLTFDEVKAIYGDTYAGYSATTDTKDAMDAQLNNIMGTTDLKWNDSSVTLDALDNRDSGGYMAATVSDPEDYVLMYYQNAINYYDIFIQHDDTQEIGHVGRWGMVRNNSYSMSISGITQEGLPYIPDPTDPTIVDPDNKDPENPEPADQLNTYISVAITVNPWVIWTQESTLL